MDTAKQRSAGTVLCLRKDNDAYVLLMVQNNARYKRNGSEPTLDIGAKGAIEKGENEKEAAIRETYEETGIKPVLEKGFRETTEYYYEDILWKTGRMTRISKSVAYFLAFVTGEEAKRVRMSHEHVDFEFVKIDDAIKRVKKAGQRRVLAMVKKYIRTNG